MERKRITTLLTAGMMVLLIASTAQAQIAHYNMEQAASPLIGQVGGETAVEGGSGHIYGISGPAGWGNAVGLNANGSWQLDATESAELNDLLNDFTVAAWVYNDSSIAKSGAGAHIDRIIGDDVAWDGDAWSFGVKNGH